MNVGIQNDDLILCSLLMQQTWFTCNYTYYLHPLLVVIHNNEGGEAINLSIPIALMYIPKYVLIHAGFYNVPDVQ